MLKFVVVLTVCFGVIGLVDCGVFSRNSNNNNNNNNNNNGMPMRRNYGPPGAGTVAAATAVEQSTSTKSPAYNGRSGLSAWGIITLILLVILLGMVGYYGILCYPLICRDRSRSYNIMDTESTSSGTPTRTTSDFDKFEKIDYSSRSTTPSKSHESHD